MLTISSTLVSNKLMVLMLMKGDVGTYQQILTVISLDVFFLFGLPEAIIYFFSGKDTGQTSSIKKTIYLMLMIASIFAILFSILGIDWIAKYFGNTHLKKYSIQIAILFFASIIGTCFPNICIAYGKVKSIVLLSTLNALSRVLVFLICYYIAPTLDKLINLLTIVNSIYLFLQISIIRRIEFNNRSMFSAGLNFRIVLSYSLPLFLTTIVGKLTKLTDKLMIGWLYSAEVYATYSIAARELPYTIITVAFISVATPAIFSLIKENNMNAAVSLWKKGVKFSSIFIIFAIASNIVVADDLIRFLYSDEYLSSLPIFIVYLLALLPRVAYWGVFAKATNKNYYILITSVLELFLNLILNIILIKLVGLIGAALATVASSYICVSIWFFLNVRITGKTVTDIFPVFDFFKALIINGSIAVVFYLFKIYILNECIDSVFFRLVVVALLWIILYLIIYRKDIFEAISFKKGIKGRIM